MKNKDREYLKMLCLTATSNAVQEEAEKLLHLFDILTSFAKDRYFEWGLEIKDKIAFKLDIGFTMAEITYAGEDKWLHKVKDNLSGSEEIRLLTIADFITAIAIQN